MLSAKGKWLLPHGGIARESQTDINVLDKYSDNLSVLELTLANLDGSIALAD
jgi:hypothetical protein